MTHIDRRGFLITALAAGGALSVHWPAAAGIQAGAELGIWAVIHPDDTTVIRIARSEMGQGTLTGLAQLVADELDADWKYVKAEYVAPEANLASNRAWGDMVTAGSRGIRMSVDYVRKGGALARALLIQTAAAKWNVPEAECFAALSVVTHKQTGRRFRYGELAAEAAIRAPPTEVKVKTESEWTLIGKPVKRLDTVEKLSGKLVYGIDVSLPGMLCAAIAQSPVFGGSVRSFEAGKIVAKRGVRHVVKVGTNAVAVVADKWYQAKTALAELPIVWDEGPNAGLNSAAIDAALRTGLSAKEAAIGNSQGDAAASLAGGAKTIQAVYGTEFQAHATLEPMNCTAKWDGEKIEVWTGTQNSEATLSTAAAAAGVAPSAAIVHKHHLGGGFGRRGNQDFVRQAVLIAKQVPGRPVKLIWTREEDTRHDFYRPITRCELTATLDPNGGVNALHARLAGPSILAYLMPDRLSNGMDPAAFQGWSRQEFGYTTIPNLLIDHARRDTPVPVGFWRGVNTNQNAFFMECFIDELAHTAGQDPLAFRRALLAKSPKHLAVLNAVAERAGWNTPLPAGVYRGIAQNCGYGSYCAAVAEVSVARDGALKIHRIVTAIDPGHVVNPDQVAAQAEGSFVYGLSAVLFSKITIENGRVKEGNFDECPVMRLDMMPKVETLIVPSGGFWGGVGEPTIAVAGPAVLNAIFAATGKRIRALPFNQADLRVT